MLRATLALGLITTGLLQVAAERRSPAPPASAAHPVLVFSKTASFRHDSIPTGIACLKELAEKSDGAIRFTIDATEDAAVFTKDGLAKYDAVVFLSTTGDVLNDEQQKAFEAWFKSGKGYVGIHAAADTEHTWPWYGNLVGAWFKTHPPPQKATVIVEDRAHPTTSMLPERWERFDEWYVYKENPRTKKDSPVHVLAKLDETTYDTAGNAMGDHPIAWCHEFDGGRAWYTGGGHTKESYAEPLFREHVLAGLRWALTAGDRHAAAAPERGAKNDKP